MRHELAALGVVPEALDLGHRLIVHGGAFVPIGLLLKVMSQGPACARQVLPFDLREHA